ncbi:hypothetical protein B0I37DRAFT_445457 [Chaetomium sp. MPI-CAGE-AT-0009]|nr:hypothetical protein B0I37DRAFT_445457 [Chaetomium sp. MPI-CAGE-AT-0009]
MVNDARDAVTAARETLHSAHSALEQLVGKRQELLERERVQAAIAAELPSLSSLADASIQRINKIEAGLIAAEEASTEAVRRAGRLSNAAQVTADMSIFKADFAEGIMDVLETLVMDRGTVSIAWKILAALTSGYAGGMPKRLQGRRSDIEDKLRRLQGSNKLGSN